MPTPAIVYQRVDSSTDFAALLEQCAQLAEHEPYVPMIHIECHGSEEGLEFADGSQSRWSDLKQYFVRLNVATKLNLLAVVSACDGSALASTVRVEERAPVWGLIGPTRRVMPDELERSFLAFYETLLRTSSSNDALVALRASAPEGTYMVIRSEKMFEMIWTKYREVHCSDQAIRTRAHKLHSRAQALPNPPKHSVDEIADLFREHEPIFLEQCYSTFFMTDLYQENVERFPRDNVLAP
jgi:hypothetical protein